ncbi:hypothetical protein [uncultured Bradyrhizobium sp.]|uniref:hypothetical protein n=1 Tax=uncultured Bradyrhizobium sp. TaxID=199684 RepID=UPI0026258D91|nr:hypothetical protein [uncultured Bradyrhizobium sp.]
MKDVAFPASQKLERTERAMALLERINPSTRSPASTAARSIAVTVADAVREAVNGAVPYTQPLIDAIDDYVRQITGDRTRLHAGHHSIG